MDNNCEIFQKMQELLGQLSAQIAQYTQTFDQKDFFTFSDVEERSKIYKQQYYLFIVRFRETYASLEQYSSAIATLLLEADRNMDEEKVNHLNGIFEKNLLLEKELYTFTSETENELSNDCASVSLLLNSANKLSISIKLLSDSLHA